MRSKILIKFAVIIAEFYYCRKYSKCKNKLPSMQVNYSNCKDFIIAEFYYCRKHPKCKNKLPSIPVQQRLIEFFIIASALIKKMQKQTTLLALISQGFERCFIFVAFPPFINKGTIRVPYLKEGGRKNYQYQNISKHWRNKIMKITSKFPSTIANHITGKVTAARAEVVAAIKAYSFTTVDDYEAYAIAIPDFALTQSIQSR